MSLRHRIVNRGARPLVVHTADGDTRIVLSGHHVDLLDPVRVDGQGHPLDYEIGPVPAPLASEHERTPS